MSAPTPSTSAWDTVRITARCTACGLCLITCPERALRVAPRRPAVLDACCTTCGECIEVCPVGAIEPAVSGR
jgi:electron transport complex protein RnfB